VKRALADKKIQKRMNEKKAKEALHAAHVLSLSLRNEKGGL
jgi:hypothetical protein